MISLFAEREIAGEDGAREEMKHPTHDAYSQIQACRWNAHGMLKARDNSASIVLTWTAHHRPFPEDQSSTSGGRMK